MPAPVDVYVRSFDYYGMSAAEISGSGSVRLGLS
jgi:hypothetical protein